MTGRQSGARDGRGGDRVRRPFSRPVDRTIAGGRHGAGSVLEQAITDIYGSRHAFSAVTVVRSSWISAATHSRRSTRWAHRCSPGSYGAAHVGGRPARHARRSCTYGAVHRHRRFDSADVEAGNAAWAVVLGEHHRIVRAVVGRCRGAIMTSTGDGFSAWFEQPSDAAAAARTLTRPSSTRRSSFRAASVQGSRRPGHRVGVRPAGQAGADPDGAAGHDEGCVLDGLVESTRCFGGIARLFEPR